MKVKELIDQVDWKSAGVGAGLTLLAIGACKGVKCGIKAAGKAYRAMKAAKEAGMSEIAGNNSNQAQGASEENKQEGTKE